jgi:hypothetical protein
MDKTKNKVIAGTAPVGSDFFEKSWNESWTYVKTVVDILREPMLILDKNFRVLAANEPFYRTFEVKAKDTEGQIVYDLGNGQWDIAGLRKFLEDILPTQTFFKGFQVAHDFPSIGRKVMILNGRQIYFKSDIDADLLPKIILLAMEDVTEMMVVAETLAGHTNQLQAEFREQTKQLEVKVEALQKEIQKLSRND